MSEETLYESPVPMETEGTDAGSREIGADKADVDAVDMGMRYMNGDGVEQDMDKALSWLSKSRSSLAYYTAAVIYEKLEKYPEAEAALISGLEDAVDTTAAGYCYLKLGRLFLVGNTAAGEQDYDQAIDCLETGLEMEPTKGKEHAGLLGLAYQANGQIYDAIHWYRIAIDEFGDEIFRQKLYELYRTGVAGLEKKREAEEAENE